MPVSRWDELVRLLSAKWESVHTLWYAQGGVIGRTEIDPAFPGMENCDKTVSIDISVLLPPIEVSDKFGDNFFKELSFVRLLIYCSQTIISSLHCQE